MKRQLRFWRLRRDESETEARKTIIGKMFAMMNISWSSAGLLQVKSGVSADFQQISPPKADLLIQTNI